MAATDATKAVATFAVRKTLAAVHTLLDQRAGWVSPHLRAAEAGILDLVLGLVDESVEVTLDPDAIVEDTITI